MDLLSQRKFSRHDIRKVESQLLQVLGWRLAPPTTFTFARDFIQTLDVPDKQELEDEALHFLTDVTEGERSLYSIIQLLSAASSHCSSCISDYGSLRFKNSSIGISAVHVVWNARRLRPSTTIKDAINALSLDASEFLGCFRWLRGLHHAKHQQPRFVSVDEAKIDPSRSISPTSVEDAALAVSQDAQEAAFVESLLSDEKLRPASPSSDERLRLASPSSDEGPRKKKARHNSC